MNAINGEIPRKTPHFFQEGHLSISINLIN